MTTDRALSARAVDCDDNFRGRATMPAPRGYRWFVDETYVKVAGR
jgi:transposase-like protein